MATKKDLEFEAAAREKEKARLAKSNAGIGAPPVRIKVPENAPGPRTAIANPAAGSGRTGGFSAQDAVDIGGVIPRQRTRVGEAPTAPPPGQLDPAITGVATPDPAAQRPVDSVDNTGKIARSPENVLKNAFLGQQGITPEVQGQDPRVFDAEGTGRFQRRQRIGAGGQDFVNLGKFEQKNGPNIFGRASEEGGPINTFVGAGLADPSNPSTVIGQGAAQAGGRFNEGFRSTSVDPELQAGIDAFKLRAASGGNLRAGGNQFRGGAASGGGDDTLRQINRINSRADKAFQNALSQGMNTKAAARIADSIRDSAGQINFQDRTRSTERNTENVVQGQRDTAALREQGEQNRLFSTQAREDQQAQVELFRDQITKPTFNAEGVQTGEERDPAAFSRIAAQIGGPEKIGQLSPQAAQTIVSRGEAITGILGNVNKIFKDNGSNQKFNNTADLVRGSKIQGKVSQTPIDFMDVLRSGNVNIFDIRDDKVTIGDEILTVGDFFGDEQFSELDLAAFIEMVGVADEEE